MESSILIESIRSGDKSDIIYVLGRENPDLIAKTMDNKTAKDVSCYLFNRYNNDYFINCTW